VQVELNKLAARWIARRRLSCNFVFVGPVMTDVTRLTARPNVRLAGSVVHQDVIRAAVERRLEVARHYDWSALMERLSDRMEALLTAR